MRDLDARAQRRDVGAVVDGRRHLARAPGVALEPADVDVRRHADLLGDAEREPERLARLAERFVAGDERCARHLDVLPRADDVEPGRAAERRLAHRELEARERVAQSDRD